MTEGQAYMLCGRNYSTTKLYYVWSPGGRGGVFLYDKYYYVRWKWNLTRDLR